MPQEKATPLRVHHYLGWIILGMILIPLIGFSLCLHIRENQQTEVNATQWKENWPKLKLGMSKEEVLHLVGAPHSTTILEMKNTSITTNPPDAKIEQDLQEKLGDLDNRAIWSYYEPIVIITHPGEDLKTAEDDGRIQLRERINTNGDEKLHGHAIKFNREGHIIEISPAP